MILRAWRAVGGECRLELMRQALDRLGVEERCLVVEALCGATGTRYQHKVRRTDEELAREFVQAFAKLDEGTRSLLVTRRFEGRAPATAELVEILAGIDQGGDADAELLLRIREVAARIGRDEALITCAFIATWGEVAHRTHAVKALRMLESRASADLVQPAGGMQEGAVKPGVKAEAGPTREMEPRPGPSAGVDAPRKLAEDSSPAETVDPGPQPGAVVDATAPAAPVEPPEPSSAARILSNDWSSPRQREDELDRVVIRAIVATEHAEFGALSREAVERLVETVLALNTSRFQSYFYVGYLEALRRRPCKIPDSAGNAARRAWYLSGYFTGARRALAVGEFLQSVATMTDADREALRDPVETGAMHRLAPIVVRAAIECGEVEVAESWIRWSGPCDEPSLRQAAQFALRESSGDADLDARLATTIFHAFACRRGIEEIHEICEDEAQLLQSFVGITRDSGSPGSAADVLEITAHSWGRHAPALELARFLTSERLCTAASLVPSDRVGLDHLALRIEAAIAAGRIRDDVTLAVVGRLARACSDGIAERRSGADGAVMDLLRDAAEVRGALRVRLGGSARHLSVRIEEFDRAISVLSSLLVLVAGIEDSAESSVATLEAWLEAGGALPPESLQVALEHAALLSCRNLPKLFVQVARRYGRKVLERSALTDVASNPESHPALLGLLGDEGVRLLPEQRWNLSRAIGRSAVREGRDPDVALRALAHMQDLVEAEPVRFAAAMIEELGAPGWELVLDEDERDTIAISSADLVGDHASVAICLQRQLNRAMRDHRTAFAEDLVEMLDARGLGEFVDAETRRWLGAQRHASERSARAMSSGLPVRVLFVGGNEVQARWDREIESWLQDRHPGVGVTWIRPGWSSNWNKPLSDVTKEIPRHGAVVLMKFVRTIFGEKVRKLASEHRKPWVACTGHGVASVKRAIESAIAVGRSPA